MFKLNLNLFLLLAVCLILTVSPAQAEDSKQGHAWCSLKSNTVNVRTGPGKRYPIKWVYKRANLPMRKVAEYDNWIKIEDYEGTTGWVHPSMVSERHTFFVHEGYTFLNKDSKEDSIHIAKLEQGVVGDVIECDEALCKVKVNNWEGYVPNNSIWGCKNNGK